MANVISMRIASAAVRWPPLSWPVQAACFAVYLLALWVLPHDWGYTGIRRNELVWQLTRLALVLIEWLPLMVYLTVKRPPSSWKWGLLGAWLPMATMLCLIALIPDAWRQDQWGPDGYDETRSFLAGDWGHNTRQLIGYIGTAFAYSWLIAGYCSLATRWWTALLRGAGLLGLMCLVDVLALAAVTGPHRMH